jgi:hypothetical protein
MMTSSPMTVPRAECARPWDAPAPPPFNPARFLLDRVPHEPSGAGWMTRCPVLAHGDRTASLSIGVGADGRLLLQLLRRLRAGGDPARPQPRDDRPLPRS